MPFLNKRGEGGCLLMTVRCNGGEGEGDGEEDNGEAVDVCSELD